MAKIIKRGDEHLRTYEVRHTCDRCKSEIEFDSKDIQTDPHCMNPYVVCPVCECFISARSVWPDGFERQSAEAVG